MSDTPKKNPFQIVEKDDPLSDRYIAQALRTLLPSTTPPSHDSAHALCAELVATILTRAAEELGNEVEPIELHLLLRVLYDHHDEQKPRSKRAGYGCVLLSDNALSIMLFNSERDFETFSNSNEGDELSVIQLHAGGAATQEKHADALQIKTDDMPIIIQSAEIPFPPTSPSPYEIARIVILLSALAEILLDGDPLEQALNGELAVIDYTVQNTSEMSKAYLALEKAYGVPS